MRKGDLKGAAGYAEAAVAQGVAHPLVLRVAAENRIAGGAFAEAGGLLNRALAMAPGDVDCLAALGLLLDREGRPQEAASVYQQALGLDGAHGGAWLGLARVLDQLEQDEPAAISYQRAVAAAPRDAAPLAGLADLHLRAGRADAARAAADAALKLDAMHALANCVRGRIDLSEGRADEARRRMEAQLVRNRLAPVERLLALNLLGDALDRLDKPVEAIGAYRKMNELIVQQHAARFGPGGVVESHLDFISRLQAGYLTQADAWRTAPAVVSAAPVARHIFVLGYPRSGNTLAAAVLGAVAGAQVLEERPTLFDADLALLRDAEGMRRLAELDLSEAERLRALYWERVRADAPQIDGRDMGGKVFIDMSPLNSLKLPVIYKLFPEATIVVCRRDPRDVVFSCFRQNFRVNAATYQMTSIEGTARHFAAVMQLLDASLPLVGARVHELVYEDFVADFPAGARALLEAAGLDWTDEALAFSQAARKRRLRTASADQVRSGLFNGEGSWRRYATWLADVQPIVAPWIAPEAP